MPYPSRHYLLAFGGPLRVEEQWSCSLRFSPGLTVPNEPAGQGLLDNIAGALGTAWAALNFVGNGAELAWAKFNPIGPDGKYESRVTTYLHEYTPTIKTAQTSSMPNQVCLVATLLTGVVRGRGSKGRMFLPIPTGSTDATGRLTTASQSASATNFKTFLDTLNAANNGMRAVVASPLGDGAMYPVEAIAIGKVFDTMRSRRTSLLEERVPVALAAGT